MNTLRTELIESQKVRSDLLKWKLLIVSGVGGVALGFSGNNPGNSHLALSVLPLACFYVDLCCRHLSLRNKAIGIFIRKGKHTESHLKAYEEYYSEVSTRVWRKLSLESVALMGLTTFVSIIIVPIGILAGGHSWLPWTWPSGLFYSAGLTGLIGTIALQKWYGKQRDEMDSIHLKANN